MHRHSIAPGRKVAILTANREGYELARELCARAVDVVAVLDLRAGDGGDGQLLGDLHVGRGVSLGRVRSRERAPLARLHDRRGERGLRQPRARAGRG